MDRVARASLDRHSVHRGRDARGATRPLEGHASPHAGRASAHWTSCEQVAGRGVAARHRHDHGAYARAIHARPCETAPAQSGRLIARFVLGDHQIVEDEIGVVLHGRRLNEVGAPCCVRLGASQAQRRDQRCDDFPTNQQRHACSTPCARSRLGSVGVARVDRGETAVERAGENVDERALPRCGVAADACRAVDGLRERHVEREVLVVAQADFDVTRRRALERFGEDVELLMVRDEVGVVAARRDARHERALDDDDNNGSSVETRVGSGVIDRVAGTNAFVAACDGE